MTATFANDGLLNSSDLLLATLLKDHTTTPIDAGNNQQLWRNIIWATHDYENKGEGYGFNDQITPMNITGEGVTIRPRALKNKSERISRSKNMAEVFTPAWVCNKQNNLVDNQWFGKKGVFNTENADGTWTVNTCKITFPKGRTWQEYVTEQRIEISCGEAPYLVSRYDATTGQPMPVENRIGLLDRKLRIVSENTNDEPSWIHWASIAIQSTYGFEYQGDSLLIARESILATFKDFYEDKFQHPMSESSPQHIKILEDIANYISCNIFQMDGTTLCIPGTSIKAIITDWRKDGGERLYFSDCLD